MIDCMLRYYRPEGQIGRRLGGVLRSTLKDMQPQLKSIGINIGSWEQTLI